jgi:hypothetical protein
MIGEALAGTIPPEKNEVKNYPAIFHEFGIQSGQWT